MQADEIGAVNGSQTPGNDGAVFAGHLHHIRHRADGGQGAVAGKQCLLPVGAAQSQHQLQRHAAAGQMLKGIIAIAAMRVHHGHGIGQHILTFVVVGDDHLHAQRVGKGYLVHAGNAAVHRNQQTHAPVMQTAYGILTQAVAVLDAARDVVHHIRATGAQIVHQYDRGGNAVHIVVAENGDLFPGVQRPADTLRRRGHVAHEKGGMGQCGLTFQKGCRLCFLLDAPTGQHTGHQVRVARRHQSFHRMARRIRYIPVPKLHPGGHLPSLTYTIILYYIKSTAKGKG